MEKSIQEKEKVMTLVELNAVEQEHLLQDIAKAGLEYLKRHEGAGLEKAQAAISAEMGVPERDVRIGLRRLSNYSE